MALGGRDVLKLVVDADSSGATREFDKLGHGIKKSLGDAEQQAKGFSGKLGSAFDGLAQKSPMVSGIFDKLGVSGQQAGAAIASAIPMAAVAAGGAIAAFVAKGVGDFERIALAAGKFGEATGLGVEAASRWIAVGDDIGVSATTIQSAFIKMEKAIASNRTAFGDMVVTGKNGGTDLTATFLNVTKHLQGIKDPIERAAESSKLFGKGFADVSQLIGMSADDIKKRLGEVSDAQVITPAELAKARDFQEAMDNLGDSARDVGMALGQTLVPALTSLANLGAKGITIAVEIKDVGQALNEKSGGFLGFLTQSAKDAIIPIDPLVKGYNTLKGALDGAAPAAAGAAAAFDGGHGASLRAADGARQYAVAVLASAEANARLYESEITSAGAIAGEAKALRDANDALAAHTNALLASFDSTFAVKDAQAQFNEALMTANLTAQDSSKTAGEVEAAYDNETKAALGVASATVRFAEDQAKAEGKTLSAKDAQNVLIGTLYTLAGTASGPVHDSLVAMIQKLQETGNQHPEPTVTLKDEVTKPVDAAQTKLDVIGRTKATAAIHADDQASGTLGSVTSKLREYDGKTYTANISLNRIGSFAVPYLHADGRFYKRGGFVPGSPNQAFPAVVHGGEYVLSADVVDRIKAGRPSEGASVPGGLPMSTGGGSSRAYSININAGVGDPVAIGRAVKQAIAAAERAGVN